MAREGVKICEFPADGVMQHPIVHIPVQVHQQVAQASQGLHGGNEVIREEARLVQDLERILVVFGSPCPWVAMI